MLQNARFVVTKDSVLQISSPRGCADFFSKLGFDYTSTKNTFSELSTDERSSLLQQIHPRPDVYRQVQEFYRLAQRKDHLGELTVYLYLTKNLTQTLAKHIFNDLANPKNSGDFLAILADPDFAEIEIVYVDRHAGTAAALQQPLFGFSNGSIKAQFRSLAFSRKADLNKIIRILNRFVWPTTRSVITQRAVLSSAFDGAEWSEDYFTNRALFSDYYLNTNLRLKSTWKDIERDASFTRAWDRLKKAYEDAGDELTDKPSSELRKQLLDETLQTLGFDSRQPAVSTGQRGPDYVLYARRSALHADDPQVGTQQNRLSVCLAYEWNRNLDGHSDRVEIANGDDPLDLTSTDFENPGAVIVSLLDQEEQKQVNWAILTNGKIWRLYSAKAHNRATNYYEIDLEDILAIPRDNPEEAKIAFRYFWLFFRAEAFMPRPYDDYKEEQAFLDYVLRESTEYAIRLGDSLKKMIFDEVFAHFAGGLVHNAQAEGTLPPNLADYDEQQQQRLLKPFFDATLTFLYRLLFLLYAESRNLLPIYESHGFYKHSLSYMKSEIARELKNNRAQAVEKLDTYKIDSYDYYEQLQALFRAVDKGNEAWNIPVYNGGLFQTEVEERDFTGLDAEGFPLIAQALPEEILKQHRIDDRALVTGLDLLTRDKDPNRSDELAMVDYKSLGVRQLGSIYEGLLEFRLRIALEDMVEIKGNKLISYSSAVAENLYKPGKTPILLENTVYIENDRHERKTSGSYYTPDYIVEYIVAQTIGPIMDAKEQQLLDKFRAQERHLLEKVRRNKHFKNMHWEPEQLDKSQRNQELVDEFFDIKVLDPAMGSGHFLVETVDFITRRMLTFLNRFPLNPVNQALNAIRMDINTEMEKQNVSIDSKKLTDINLLKRQILKRCVYGVDLNPMAVELAKVSVWLDSFTVGAPLSFLDHHLKRGNSLIGARIEDARKSIETGQQTLFFGNNVWAGALLSTQGMIRISKLIDVTPNQAKESKKEFSKAESEIMPYKQLLNVYLSRWFSNPVKANKDKYQIDKALNFIHSDEAQAWIEKANNLELNQEQKTILNNAKHDTEIYNFFHWELEFPEVFIDPIKTDLKKNAGFDAVVGNPPYIRMQEHSDIANKQNDFFVNTYDSAKHNYDIYVLFAERGFQLLSKQKSSNQPAFAGFILPNKFFTVDYGKGLREFLIKNDSVYSIIDFNAEQIFKEATTYTCLLFLSNIDKQNILFYQLPNKQNSELVLKNSSKYQELFSANSLIIDRPWLFHKGREEEIFRKIDMNSERLDEVTERIFQGIKTGADKIYIVECISENDKTYKIFSEQLNSSRIVEKDLWHLLAKGGNFDHYDLKSTKLLILFPYGKDKNGKMKLILENSMREQYPQTYNYLQENKKYLENRENGKMNNTNWYAFTRNQALDIMESPKILTPDFAPSASFTLDDIGNIFFPGGAAGGYGILVKKAWNREYILALLNSKLLDWRLSKHTSIFRGGWRSYESRFISELPIRRINFANSENLREYHRRQAQKLYEEFAANPDKQQTIITAVEQHLAQEPEESDVVHDLLATLAEQMLGVNKEKRRLQQEFLSWLTEFLRIQPQPDPKSGKVGIDALTHKGDLLNYPGDYQKGEEPLTEKALEQILLDNKKRYLEHLNAYRWTEIQDHYHDSLDKILPLKMRLKQTDALIDKIVYKLYGLTEDEIRVVEGEH